MEEKVSIILMPVQRELLLKYEPYFTDPDLFRLISVAGKKGNKYEIWFTEDQLGNLLDQITDCQSQEKNKKIQEQLDDLWRYFESCFDLFQEDEGEDDMDYSEYSQSTGSVCILKVALEGAKKIWRKIAIRDGQTLHCLHDIIYDAFDREEEHLYSFFFPYSPQKFNPRKIFQSSDEYTHPYACEHQGGFSSEAQNASKTPIESLNLTEGQVFYYLFDFGEEWWHEITVEKTEGVADEEEYPRILERKGESPAQYECPDEEEENA